LRNGRPRCNGFLSENHPTDGFGPISGHFEESQTGHPGHRIEQMPVFGFHHGVHRGLPPGGACPRFPVQGGKPPSRNHRAVDCMVSLRQFCVVLP